MGFLLLSGSATAVPAYAQAPSVSVFADHTVTLTAYNAVPEQTDSTPFETASGAYSNPEVVAARSQDLAGRLPFGTIIEIDGTHASKEACGYDVVKPLIGYRVIADVMNPRYTDRIDVLFDTEPAYALTGGKVKSAGLVLGICKGVTIRIVGYVGISRIPKTQVELAALVTGASSPLAFK